jgi:tetratricopeptide (TPR) repeat protein
MGLNYVEMELGRFPGGVQAVDATYYLTGERLSRTLARLMGRAQSAMDDGDLKDGMAMQRISMLQRQGDTEGALALIKELPPALRADKSIMLLEIGLDPGTDDTRYLAAIERFENAFPNDPALDLVSIDGFFMRKQFDRLLAAIDRLDERVKDPYLDVMRALAYLGDDKLDKALVHVDRAIEREPTLEDAWDAKSTICLTKKDFACAFAAITVLVERFELPITDEVVGDLEHGPELLASEEYKAWRGTGSD